MSETAITSPSEPVQISPPTAPTKQVSYKLDDYSDLPSANGQPKVEITARDRDPATGKFLPRTEPLPTAQPETSQTLTSPSPAAPHPTQTPATPTHSPVLLQIARQFGIDEETIRNVSSDQLRADIQLINSLQSQQPQPQAPAPPPPEVYDWGKDEEGRPYTEEQVHPALVMTVKENRRLQKELEATRAEFRQAQTARSNAEVWTVVNGLFNKHPSIYGTGATNKIDPESPEGIRRASVVDHLKRLVAAKKHTTPEEDWARIHAALYPGTVAPPAPTPQPNPAANGRITQEQWDNAGLAPTSQRLGTEPVLSRRDQKIKDLAERRREQGIPFVPAFNDNSDMPKAQ